MTRDFFGSRAALWRVLAWISAVASVSGFGFWAWAQTVPPSESRAIPYQGWLEQGGGPVTGPVDMRFSLWNAASAGAEVWSELYNASASTQPVAVVDGRFAVLLGALAPLPPELPAALYLKIEVGSPLVALSGRQPLAAVAYAHRAAPGSNFIVDGKVGIGTGTGTPAQKLEVVGNATVSGSVGIGGQTHTATLRLGDKWLLSGAGDAHGNDDWLRLFDAGGTGYYGGLAVGKLWVGGDVAVSGTVTGKHVGTADCYDANWSISFDSAGWSTCDYANGYVMVGLYRAACSTLLNCIEHARCCRIR